MAKKAKPKSPNDYPLLGYRVLPAIRESVVTELEDVLKQLNLKQHGDKPSKKNDLFVDAIRRGLAEIKIEEGLK